MKQDIRKYTMRNLSQPFFPFRLSITLQLIIVNVIAFIILWPLMMYQYISADWIAINPSNILAGKYFWTFLSSMFMHAGFFHIFANMFSLMFVGSLVERLLGRKRYLSFYLASGIFAGLLFVVLAKLTGTGLNTYAVGASGALFALIGFLMLITPNLPVYVMFIPIPIKMKYAAPGILIVLWLISITPTFFGGSEIPIANTAHLGGLIAGLLYAIYIKNKYKQKTALISRQFS